jgi:hypothetical protein
MLAAATITIHFAWYWFVLRLLLFWLATFELVRHTAGSARFDVAALVLYIGAAFFAGLAVVRDLPFVAVFSVAFGTVFALANWASLKNRATRMRQTRPEGR